VRSPGDAVRLLRDHIALAALDTAQDLEPRRGMSRAQRR
jgi:hypothetical protein